VTTSPRIYYNAAAIPTGVGAKSEGSEGARRSIVGVGTGRREGAINNSRPNRVVVVYVYICVRIRAPVRLRGPPDGPKGVCAVTTTTTTTTTADSGRTGREGRRGGQIGRRLMNGQRRANRRRWARRLLRKTSNRIS